MPEQTPQEVFEVLHREIEKMAVTAREHGIYFFGMAMLNNHETKETDITKSMNLDGAVWATMVADMVEDFPELEEATLVGIRMVEMGS